MIDTARYAKSDAAHEAAKALMPGGVSSPVRAYQAVGRTPVTVERGEGPYVFDVDGNRYIDFVMSYGPLIFGHGFAPVVEAIAGAARSGGTFGMPTVWETELARRVVDAVPSVEVVRFVNSGTEAAMSALRLARAAAPGRGDGKGASKIIKCQGCYHGHTDALLVAAGSAATSLGTPSSPGVPASTVADTLLVPYNDADAVEAVMRAHPGEIACMAVEPIAGNMGCVPPAPGYLQRLRELCDAHHVLLLFDEVMTGFRVALGGAQALHGVTPDLSCLGKVIGGGMPCAAYGGSEAVMRHVSPDGPVYQAGTLSGNPMAMAAGIAQLDALAADGGPAYDRLEALGARLEAGLRQAAADAGCPLYITRVGSMLCPFFVGADGDTVTDYADATACRLDRYTAFFNAMLDGGVMLAPAAFEAWFISTAHDEAVIDAAVEVAREAFAVAAGR